MIGWELEERLIRTPIIQRNSDKGGKEKAHLVEQLCYQPYPSSANSRPVELIKQKLQPLGGRHRVLDQEYREFSSGLDTILIVIFAFVFFYINRKIRLYNIEIFDM